MGRLLLVLVPASGLVGAVFYVAVLGPWLLARQPQFPTPQDIAFDHRVHVQAAGIDCAFCHRTADKGATAGMPELEQCMFCHQSIGQGNQEMEKVRASWSAQQPVNWQRVNRLPDHVRFVHDAHVQAGVDCANCHGDVGGMETVNQARPLSMSDCVDCHKQRNAPTDCAACHY